MSSSQIYLPPILYSIARNPITAVGLPLTLGTLSGLPTHRVVKGFWYNVSPAYPKNRAKLR